MPRIAWWHTRAEEITIARKKCQCGASIEGVFLVDRRHGRAVIARCLSCKRTEYIEKEERRG